MKNMLLEKHRSRLGRLLQQISTIDAEMKQLALCSFHLKSSTFSSPTVR
jgi:hypothetical protein